MKTLYFLRHAKTEGYSGSGDKNRNLLPEGVKAAQAQGAAMKQKNYQPDFILCSPAVRTRQTLEHVMESLNSVPVENPEFLYDGGAGDIFMRLQELDDQYDKVLVVGHNPWIHELAGGMAQNGDGSLIGQLLNGYRPGTLSVFECTCESWASLTRNNTLVDYLPPSG